MRLTVGPLTKLTITDINQIAYGYPYTDIKFIRGSYVTAPAANSDLITFTLPSNKKGAVVAVVLDATEPNLFDIVWISGGQSRSYRVRLPADGVMAYDFKPGLNLDLPADPNTSIVIRNVNAAGAGAQYKADMLVGLW